MPITCLSTTYKLQTSVITERMNVFMMANDLFPIEQKGCKRGFYGCKGQLLINRMIIEDCKSKHRNLSIAWIEYRKAFDSVPHSWALKVLDLFKISPVLINFLRINMSMWKITLNLTYQNGNLKLKPIKINSGIIQGDSLSPLLFCLSLINTLVKRIKPEGYTLFLYATFL